MLYCFRYSFIVASYDEGGSFNSNFDPESHASMSYLCGKQDFGRFIMSEVIEADPNLYIKMMKLNSKELTNGPESTTD